MKKVPRLSRPSARPSPFCRQRPPAPTPAPRQAWARVTLSLCHSVTRVPRARREGKGTRRTGAGGDHGVRDLRRGPGLRQRVAWGAARSGVGDPTSHAPASVSPRAVRLDVTGAVAPAASTGGHWRPLASAGEAPAPSPPRARAPASASASRTPGSSPAAVQRSPPRARWHRRPQRKRYRMRAVMVWSG
jgi:hypothetical protein